jgi:hypothetical protein
MLDISRYYAPNKDNDSLMRSPTAATSQGQPNLILIEPDLTYLPDRALLLAESDYCVTTLRDVRELFFMQDRRTFAVALLSQLLGAVALDSAARYVRSQWPVARILILGQAAQLMEDYLYDEAIDQFCKPQDLLKAVATLSHDPQQSGGRPFVLASPISKRSNPLGKS